MAIAHSRIDWNGPHIIENAGQAESYSREQHVGVIDRAAALGSKYLRVAFEFSYHFRLPEVLYTGDILPWYYYTALSKGVIPMAVLHGHPNIGIAGWNAFVPNDGRFRHGNKPEPEQQAAVLNCYRMFFDAVANEALRVGIPLSSIPMQNGNEMGKGGGGDWRPYPDLDPPNPEAAANDGHVPTSVVTFRTALLAVIREYGFMAVGPALEAETTTILTEELASTGWAALIQSHDIAALHSYPNTAGNMNRTKASREARIAFAARKAILVAAGVTKPVWCTEVGRTQSECKPTGPGVATAMAQGILAAGAERAFSFVLVMNDNAYAAYGKGDLSGTAPSWPGEFSTE